MLLLIAECYGREIQFPLGDKPREITVGSLSENEICLPYKGVSRRHFVLTLKGHEWTLKDLGSTNGTRLNGAKVTESPLKPGDSIQAGVVTFKVLKPTEARFLPIPITDETPLSNHTDEMSDSFASSGGFLSSDKLVFPEGMLPEKSPKMTEIYLRLHSLVDSDVNILLIGETGTGKEMFARMLHLSGTRSGGSFVAVNCAAIPSDLVEAELFGIGERVATNVSHRKGKIVMANKGTLFLDELSAFPISLQAKVLRAIEERAVTPVGEHQSIPVDFRLICATNEDPQELLDTGRLREDLYHRVATVEVMIPPLRERKEDLPMLIFGLLRQISKAEKKMIAGISKKLFQSLIDYSYPGNVRELVNTLKSMVALAHPGEILDAHLAPGKLSGASLDASEAGAGSSNAGLQGKLNEVTKDLIEQALKSNEGNVSAAAKSLQISPFGLRKMMKRLGIPSKKK